MKKILYILAAVIIFGGGIAILYNQFFVQESPDYARVLRVIGVFAIYFVGYIRYFATRKTMVRRVNEDAYGSIIGNAFHNEGEEYDRLMKGIELYNKDRYGKAIDLLVDLLISGEVVTAQEKFAVNFFIAQCYVEQEDFVSGIETYEELLESFDPNQLYDADRNRIILYNNLGNAYNEVGQFEDAKEILEKAFNLAPGEIEAPINLAYTEFKLGNQDRAMALIDDVVAKYPECEEAVDMREFLLGKDQ